MKLILDMQKRFEEKLEALRVENSTIKAHLNDQKNNSKRVESPEKREKAIRKI